MVCWSSSNAKFDIDEQENITVIKIPAKRKTTLITVDFTDQTNSIRKELEKRKRKTISLLQSMQLDTIAHFYTELKCSKLSKWTHSSSEDKQLPLFGMCMPRTNSKPYKIATHVYIIYAVTTTSRPIELFQYKTKLHQPVQRVSGKWVVGQRVHCQQMYDISFNLSVTLHKQRADGYITARGPDYKCIVEGCARAAECVKGHICEKHLREGWSNPPGMMANTLDLWN
eukprot:TRINITY_DN60497_c0_g1_i1.p1 TRINITY_DN60497_c0_g1~~TRINITY_DN60497_c0_g1_i1.p1  ORF type:complete len:227 (-),score=20.69 TRINITY_DN60497_c0_g1_i1:124-804(-)